jgi:hypothetical protein
MAQQTILGRLKISRLPAESNWIASGSFPIRRRVPSFSEMILFKMWIYLYHPYDPTTHRCPAQISSRGN